MFWVFFHWLKLKCYLMAKLILSCITVLILPSILGNLDMPGHTHLKWQSQIKETWQKINFILHVFLKILQIYCKLVVLGTFGISRYAHTKWHYHLAENVCFYLQAKNQLHPSWFLGDIGQICKLFILGKFNMSGYTNLKWSNQLVQDFHVYLRAKNELNHSFLSCNIPF